MQKERRRPRSSAVTKEGRQHICPRHRDQRVRGDVKGYERQDSKYNESEADNLVYPGRHALFEVFPKVEVRRLLRLRDV